MFKFKRLSPKGVKICPGCPPKDTPTLSLPKIKLELPAKSSKVTTIKGELNDNDPNRKLRKGESKKLF